MQEVRHILIAALAATACLQPCSAETVFREVAAEDLPAASGWELRQFPSIEAAQGVVGWGDGPFDLVIHDLVPDSLYMGVHVISYGDPGNQNHVDNLGYDVSYTGDGGVTVEQSSRSFLGTRISYSDVNTPQAGTARHKSGLLPDVLTDSDGNATFTFKPFQNPDATTADLTKLRSYIDGVVFEKNAPTISSFTSGTHRMLGSGTTSLSWSVDGADTITVSPDIGDVTSLTTDGAGSVAVSPAGTVTYTLTASNADGSSTAVTGIRVIGETADRRPNIILFYVDDMGWQDTSLEFHSSRTLYNSRYITPNMESLAARGTKFTNAYAAATICQASRYALMSGLLPTASGYTYNGAGNTTSTVKPPPFSPVPIDSLDTLPKSIRSLGYKTIHVGKWHIKGTSPDYSKNILASGFDRKIAANDAGQPGSYQGTSNYGTAGSANSVPDLGAYHGQDVFLTEAITLETNKAIEETVSEGMPFFLFLSHYAIHTPIQRDSRFTANYDDPGDGDHYIANGTERSYATMVEGMDKSLGDVMAKLDALGVAGDTLIVFSSDHGGLCFQGRGPSAYPNAFPDTGNGTPDQSHNWPLRYGKGWVYEGGVRVPTVISWGAPDPANPIQARYPVRGDQTEHRPVSQLDFFPTLMAAAGGVPPETIHGYDISHYLSGADAAERPAKFLWHQPHWRPDHDIPQCSSMRHGRWKVVHRIESGAWELYDLSTDIHETNDLAASHPRELALFSREMVRELERNGALYPTWVSDGSEIRPLPEIGDGVDADFDGIPDAAEDSDGDGLIDLGESDPSLFDDLAAIEFNILPSPGLTTGVLTAIRPVGTGAMVGMRLQESFDLIDWGAGEESTQVSDNADGTETLFWFYDTAFERNRLLRLEILNLELIAP